MRARFLRRPNRFLIRCRWRGRILSAFLPNPGRLQELLLPGCVVHLVREKKSSNRKTSYTAVAVDREGQPILLHTHRTNDVARALLQKRKIPGLEHAEIVRSEIPVGRSRFDFLLKEGGQDILVEVKSCTLVGERVAMFPDAVTERGARHLRELAEISARGVRTVVLFVVHWPFARTFMPDYHTDLNFSQTLLRVRDNVEVIPISVRWGRDLSLSSEVRVLDIPWDTIDREARDRGSYLLILKVKRSRKIDVGKLGTVHFRKGFYIYVGSAMTNLSRRMERHRHLRKKHHWHIDELRAAAEFHSVFAIRSSERLECEVAEAVSKIAETSVPRFGSTDCSCETHLFGTASDPIQSENFQRLLQHFRMDRLLKPQTLNSKF
ncbi:MAG TPA: DNA/RNA nuclease SfsA [Thermodesulfobacteriota bacterium]|nr:DNA/RNA nuclease SfsA [Thermodesulfobacteriota bacterium]